MAGQVLNPQVSIVDQQGVMSLPFYKYLLSLQNGATGSYAPINAPYVTVSLDPTLTQERRLAAGTGITLTDNGAGSTLVIAATGSVDDALTVAWLGL